MVPAHEELLWRVCAWRTPTTQGWCGPIVNRQRRKLGDDTKNPAYIFAEPRGGYQMPQRKGQGELVAGRQI